jgi:multicomponent Na+:H+ antiporter subunit E
MTLRYLACVAVVLAIWLLLFWSIHPLVVASGVALALVIGYGINRIYSGDPTKWLNPWRWFWALLYVPYLFYYCLKGSVDLSLRVLHPDVPLRPGIVKVTTTLKSPMARAVLANSITLTPGILTIDQDEETLYVHWINVHTDDPAERNAEIVGVFEPMLRRIFE